MLRTNVRSRIYAYLEPADLVLLVSKFSRFERRLLPKITQKLTSNRKSTFENFNVVIPSKLMQNNSNEPHLNTRMHQDFGLTYIIKLFKHITLHLKQESCLRNIPILFKIIQTREANCKISLVVWMLESYNLSEFIL